MCWLQNCLSFHFLELVLDLLRGVMILLLTICFLNYAISRISWEIEIRNRSSSTHRFPPTIPSTIPFLGNLPSIAINSKRFIHDSTWALKTPNPFGFRLFTSKLFVLQGAQNINAFWKKDAQMTGMTAQIFCLKYLFRMPTAALQMYIADNSGFNEKPALGSMISFKDRVDYQTHASLLNFTSGKHFSGFYQRWFKSFAIRLQTLHTLNDWVQQPDLLGFFERDFALSVVEATCGIILEKQNPNFAQDLAAYARFTPSLSKGLPRWVSPRAYAARDKVFDNIKEWHRIARENFKSSCIDNDGDADPFWGSEFMRSRQKMFENFKGFDADAAAASDLGFIWALTFNIVPTMMWVVLEIHRDPMLRSKIRAELKDEGLLRDLKSDDIKRLLALPRLQGVYAECLRLRDQVMVPRETTEEVQVNGWKFPKMSTIMIATHEAHSDRTAWNTGTSNMYPIDKFWAERFLVYPNDANSGPIVKSSILLSGRLSETQSETQNSNKGKPLFSDKTTMGYWMPYGGGARICPGRHFAKRAILTAAAMMTTMVDIEILADERHMQVDESGYGLGVQRPVGKVSYRIRSRQGNDG